MEILDLRSRYTDCRHAGLSRQHSQSPGSVSEVGVMLYLSKNHSIILTAPLQTHAQCVPPSSCWTVCWGPTLPPQV